MMYESQMFSEPFRLPRQLRKLQPAWERLHALASQLVWSRVSKTWSNFKEIKAIKNKLENLQMISLTKERPHSVCLRCKKSGVLCMYCACARKTATDSCSYEWVGEWVHFHDSADQSLSAASPVRPHPWSLLEQQSLMAHLGITRNLDPYVTNLARDLS